MNYYIELIRLLPLLGNNHTAALAVLVPGTLFAVAEVIRALKSDGRQVKED